MKIILAFALVALVGVNATPFFPLPFNFFPTVGCVKPLYDVLINGYRCPDSSSTTAAPADSTTAASTTAATTAASTETTSPASDADSTSAPTTAAAESTAATTAASSGSTAGSAQFAMLPLGCKLGVWKMTDAICQPTSG